MKLLSGRLAAARLLRISGCLHDLVAAAASFYIAFGIIYDFGELTPVSEWLAEAFFFTLISGVYFFVFSLNRGFWRYASLPDFIAIMKASALSAGTYALLHGIMSQQSPLPKTMPLLLFIFVAISLGGPRMFFRVLREDGHLDFLPQLGPRRKPRPAALLYGISENAEAYIRLLRGQEHPEFEIVGIIDDDTSPGRLLQGIKVLGTSRGLAKTVRKIRRGEHPLSDMIVSDPRMPPDEINTILQVASACGLHVSRLPDLRKTVSVNLERPQARSLRISDLLARPETGAGSAPISGLVESKTLLITGAGGSIGSELARQAAGFNPRRMIISDISEFNLYSVENALRDQFPTLDLVTRIADIRDRARLNELFATYRPELVFHAAALKHVPLVEENAIEGVKTNLLGTRNLADCAVRHGVRSFVLISTDKAVNPTNVMGATKRAAEAYCQAVDLAEADTRFTTVRFGNVLGSNGSVVPRFEEQIAHGGPVTVTHPEIARYFMSIPEAVRLVLRAVGYGEDENDRGRILVLDMGEPVKIADLARRMIELAGLEPGVDIKIEYTGLRPGEKLYEELFEHGEIHEIRRDRGYLIAAPRIIETAVIRRSIASIEKAIAENSSGRVIELLRHLVPEYRDAPAEIADGALPDCDAEPDARQTG